MVEQAASGHLVKLTSLAIDRIQLISLLIVLCFVAVLLLSSQSAASYPTYLLAAIMLATVGRWNDVFQVRLMWMTVALLGYLALSSLWSTPFAIRDAVSTLSRTMLVLFFLVAFAETQLRGWLRLWLGRALALVGFVAVVAAIVVFVLTDPADGRLNGLGQLDTHVVAALVFGAILIFVADVAATDDSVWWRWVAVACGVVIAVAVWLSDSRNAWVSVIAGLGVFSLAHLIRDVRQFVASVTVLAFGLTVLLGVLFAGEATREVVLPRGDSFRLDIWSHHLQQIISDGLWFGLGINTSDNVEIGGVQFLHPHSMYLSVAHQGGILGLALFVLTICGVIRELVLNFDHADAKLALGILGVALPSYLLDGHELIDKVGATWFLFWVPVAVALGLQWHKPRRS